MGPCFGNIELSDPPEALCHFKEACKQKRKQKEKKKKKKNHEMASRNKLLRKKATAEESKQERGHLSIKSRIRESIGSPGKKENVMIQNPRMGTAPQTISQSP